MYFEIENTPEHIRKARRAEPVQKRNPVEECPRLTLAPFSRPPQVVFENVTIGTTCERTLEILNPSKQVQQITLGRALPAGLVIQLPEEWLELEPETCYCLSMLWTPMQPTALRDTIRFTNENRGRYDVIVVLKTGMNIKVKGKGFKVSPGKIKKKPTKKSPVAIYKKKAEMIYNTTMVKKTVNVVQTTQHRVLRPSNKENIMTFNDYNSQIDKCPFDSQSSIDFNFDTSEVFSNMRKPNSETFLHKTYDKSYTTMPQKQNTLKPSNNQTCNLSASDVFDNLTFTPLKSLPAKTEKLDKGPKIIMSMNSESDFDDSLDMKQSNKENETHSILSITSTQPNKWLTVNHHAQLDSHIETPNLQNKKIPNTSSPKELNSPNFSINTDFSRISELSFFPQRFSTERKGIPRINNETHDLLEDANAKLSSDTYTKDSPNTPVDFQMYTMESKPPHYFNRDQQPKLCRQSLFKEYQMREMRDRNFFGSSEFLQMQNDLRVDVKSPPRSITPPLQSIPEESLQLSDTHNLDKTDKMSTFTINRTFDKDSGRLSMMNNRQSWSKKSVRVEPELWKVPTSFAKKSLKPKVSLKGKESLSGKITNATFDANNTTQQSMSILNHIGNVYSQSHTVDPFLSSTYFYDEEAVDKFEKEFKRWLNCVLTPPADLDSNIEQKIDVGKAWLENRNKEVPLAPTKEQVSSVYHNSHRLESLRRSARALLMSPEIAQVFQKLNVQIEKKLIAIRTDRNLHLDVGLQKVIMELLLSYNPLWLRLGLEAIYGIVLPLRSNSDIEGLTTFIIQRMFKNPHLKNKHSKSNAPNMLLPAYMEAIKKFTLKKFFMLVFFLDQAKQRKLISHDPCLFCRNAICKESREIIIRFTRELIAGIGDITKHLRPLGYVVSHKQSFLDEYKYAVHNIALDIRDGVRLTKVMEIILMKNGLMHQLRTPAISRLQKIHNVQVALNALKEANFVIVGDISAQDIADGHREKTLSLLWQLIHVFRAPLFEKAANVIQTWWRKKYEVIVAQRKEEERVQRKLNSSASVIQRWWRRIQYNRLVEWQMQQVTSATVTIQKYCRMWLCRTQYRRMKTSVLILEKWYKSVVRIRESKEILARLRVEREQLRSYSACVIQSYVRRWLCMIQFKKTVKKIVFVQSLIRQYLIRKQYLTLKKHTISMQQKFRNKILMRKEMQHFQNMKKNIIVVQSYIRMIQERRRFNKLKNSVILIQKRFRALIEMRNERKQYLNLKKHTIILQSIIRGKSVRNEYLRQRTQIIQLQRKFRAHLLMRKYRAVFLQKKKAAMVLQNHIKAYLDMKRERNAFVSKRNSAVAIQKCFRSYVLTKSLRTEYLKLREAIIKIQRYYRSVLVMRKERNAYQNKRKAIVSIQQHYRAYIMKKKCQAVYLSLLSAVKSIQQRYKALIQMRRDRTYYLQLKSASVNIQSLYRAKIQGREQRRRYLNLKDAVVKIQRWFRNCKKGKEVQVQYEQSKKACVVIQRIYRAYVIGRIQRQEYLRIRTATVRIQNYYRSYIEMKVVRQQYIQLKTATVTIQKYYKSHLMTKNQRQNYLKMKAAARFIEDYYRRYKESQQTRQRYLELQKAARLIQDRYRNLCAMQRDRKDFLNLKQSVLTIQQRYRALLAMRKERKSYNKLLSSTLVIQRRFRAQCLMKQERRKFVSTLKACVVIQRFYRACLAAKKQLEEYSKLKKSVLIVQQKYRALLAMRRDRTSYLKLRQATVCIQRRYRARCLMMKERSNYVNILNACVTIQRTFRAYIAGKRQRAKFIEMKSAAIKIQRYYRYVSETRKIRANYLTLKKAVVCIQLRFRYKMMVREVRRIQAASKIQAWYRSLQQRNVCRHNYLKMRVSAITIQSIFRMHILRKKYVVIRHATLTVQRYYRSYKLGSTKRQEYVQTRNAIIALQAYVRCYIARMRYIRIRRAVLVIQAAYKFKKERDLLRAKREAAAICIQKYVRRYIVKSRYLQYRKAAVFIQRLWKGKLVTRLLRCEFLQKRNIVIRLQSVIRGYLVRKRVELQKENLIKAREEQKQYWAASKIQALFRGHKARVHVQADKRVAELRRRWRAGALESNQESLKERNEEAMEVLRNMSDIETVIRAFRSLELLTEVFPMMYHDNASSIVRRVYIYMSVTNRSISSIEVLKSAASVLVNLTRYKVTGPKIYARDRIPPILKFMWRFSNSETHLFCILSTYIWLFSKYDDVKKDLTEFLHIPENHKMLTTIKGNVDRMKRMATNARNKFHTPQPSKFVSHTGNQSLNQSVCSSASNSSILLPALEPDYGIVRADKPRYFEDAQQAINCLFHTYKL
ncbi:protein abnormal spindle [Ostrinia nubilalis]|uniref:protein abnormal spindle n=1 Tax=Ostrinia nubilalis TaxID=29057 RepID=UPI0030824FC4